MEWEGLVAMEVIVAREVVVAGEVAWEVSLTDEMAVARAMVRLSGSYK